MKIAWLSSWPPRACGIATYSDELVSALRDAGHEIHILCHPDGGKEAEKNVYRVLETEKHGWDEAVYDTVKRIDPDIVHIQHEFGLYNTAGDNSSALFRPVFRWKIEKKPPVVITYHSVYTELNPMISSYMDVMQSIVDGGIVHAEYQWANLHANLGRIVDNVYVIPHGAALGKRILKDKAKQALGLQGEKVIGMIGWFTRTKGFHRVLSLWDELTEKIGSGTTLVLAGDARLRDSNQITYKDELLNLVEKSKAKSKIKVVLGSFAPEEYDQTLASFDVMVMPYSYASQSGNLAHSFSLGVPVIASGLEGLKAEVEASGAGIAVAPEDDAELVRAIVTMMSDDVFRKDCGEKAKRYIKECIGWPIIAKKHLQLYKKVIQGKTSQPPDLRSKALLRTNIPDMGATAYGKKASRHRTLWNRVSRRS